MNKRSTGRAMRGWTTAGSLLALLAAAPPALAQAQASVRRYDIPAQPLSAAILDFSRQSDVLIVVAPGLTAGKQSLPLSGSMTISDGLNRLLRGTDLQAVPNPAGGYRIATPHPTRIAYAEPAPQPVSPQLASPATLEPSAVEPAEEIVVTANKRQERISTVPVAMDVVTSKFLNDTSANQLTDYIGYLPNVVLVSNGATGSARIYIRGITSVGGGSTVGVYIDDAPFGSSTSFASGANLQPDLDPSSLKQIEVLKGPQGTLYGSGSEGGLIKYVSRLPDTRNTSFGFTEETSSIDHGEEGYAFRAHGNLPLVQDAVAIEGNVYYRRDPGFVDNLATGKRDDNDDIARGGFVSLLAQPIQALKIRVSGLVQSLDVNGLTSIPVGAGVDQTGGVLGPPVFGKYDTYLKDKQGSFTKDGLYTATLDYQLPWATLASTTSYSNVKNFTAYGDSGYDNDDYGLDPSDTLQNSMTSGTHKVTEELRLASIDKGPLQWLVGGFYTHEDSLRIYQILAHTPAGAVDNTATPAGDVYTQGLKTSYSEYSVFANATLNVWRQLYLTLGGRYSDYDQHYVQTRAGEIGNAAHPAATRTYANASTSDGAFTYLADLSWRFSGEGSVYFRAASGYRVGGPSILPPNAVTPAGFDGKFGSENLYDYELGVKRAFFAGRLSVEASAFFIDYRNLQGNMLIGGRYVVTGNPGNATSKGVEMSFQSRPLEGLTVDGALGFVDATLSQDAPAFDALKGDDLTSSPHVTGSLNIAYERRIGDELFASIGGGVRYVSNSKGDYSSVPDATYFPSETIVDLHAGLRYRRYTATLYVKNAGDTYAYENNTNASGNGPPYVAVTRPRTIGIRLSQDF